MRKIILLSIVVWMWACGPVFAQHHVNLSWTASTDAGATYDIYRLSGKCPTSSPAGFTTVNTAPITGTTFSDTTVTPGVYCYYATAVLNGAQSLPSNLVQATVPVASPTTLTITATQ